ALGTAWAVRGQFGHEQGAAWAGSIAALAIIVLAQRKDWNQKFLSIAFAAAVGWGLGGMMSYGLVVGYGQGVDFVNVYYGFVMLLVIGGLYGFLGGGLFGLALMDGDKYTVNWLEVMAYLVAGGTVAYFFLIMQWEILMTPPRSELWAACLGMALTLSWYLYKKGLKPVLRLALITSLGAGFGFAFGNFLQVLGKASGLGFNFWNVMEYSLGFFGGLGMAYGTFTMNWETSNPFKKGRQTQKIPALFLWGIIPFIIWVASFNLERLEGIYTKLSLENYAGGVQIAAIILMALYALFLWRMVFFQNPDKPDFESIKPYFYGHFAFYIFLSLLITGAFFSVYRPEQYLYLVNFGVVFLLAQRIKPANFPFSDNIRYWGRMWIATLLLLAVLAFIAIQTHESFEGMRIRFEL
ncbi:MAG: hypothetical protein KDE26_24220, partial [Bacteroidetes bacterium]|nr:hypothetical protein [Bacteroidota bacterium]